LHKVLVGVFSARENAEQLVRELKARGYDAYITREVPTGP
jgi:cell division septation protein DedD